MEKSVCISGKRIRYFTHIPQSTGVSRKNMDVSRVVFHPLQKSEKKFIKLTLTTLSLSNAKLYKLPIPPFRGCIFSCVPPFYEQAVSDLDMSMNRSLRV